MAGFLRQGGPVRRGGRLVDETGAVTTWSVAEGRRGRRWRWAIVDRRGALVVAHTLELDPDGRVVKLESAAATGLLTLHREADATFHGNRVGERGVDHLEIPAPAPGLVIVGRGPVGLAAVSGSLAAAEGPRPVDALEVLDDLGVRVIGCGVRRGEGSTWELMMGRSVRRVTLDALGLPVGDEVGSTSWSLERDETDG